MGSDEIEIASVRVAINRAGEIVVRMRSSKMAEELGLTGDFDRAAAAFGREYGKDSTVLSATRHAGSATVSPELEKLYDEAVKEVGGQQ